MAEDSAQQKTERATPRRREKAREKGQVAKSMELNSAIMIMAGVTTLFFMGPLVGDHLMAVMRHSMAHAPEIALEGGTYTKIFSDNLTQFFSTLMPIFGVMVVIGLATNISQVGFHISKKALEPKWEKFNVIKGIKNKLAPKSLVMAVRDSLKLMVIAIVAYSVISSEFESFFLLPSMSISTLAATMGEKALWITLKVGTAILLLAVLDFVYQRYDFEKSIKMSLQEVKDEFKDTEGSPQIKSRVRQLQRDMARKRMLTAVPAADVVVTNPTHIAVALKYNTDSMQAPTVVAKGERLIAQKIKEIAVRHNITVVEDKPLARALFKMCDIGELVPQSLFRAVAEVLAYVYRLKGKEVSPR